MFARGEKYKGQEGVFIGQKPKDSEGIERSLLIMFEMKGGDEIVNGEESEVLFVEGCSEEEFEDEKYEDGDD
ncbi:hypothetical protein Tco_1007908 [Tanacetum coccineum]